MIRWSTMAHRWQKTVFIFQNITAAGLEWGNKLNEPTNYLIRDESSLQFSFFSPATVPKWMTYFEYYLILQVNTYDY